MKSRTVILLWIIAIVLGVTAFAVKFGRDDDQATRTKLAPGEKIIAKLPIPEVTKVTLSRGKEMTTLVRSASDDQLWGVIERQNYPVNYELLRNLLGALSELEVAQGYPATSQHHARFGLAANTDGQGDDSNEALQITIIAQGESLIETIYLGKYSGSSQSGGRFLRLGSDEAGVYAVGETFPGVTASPRDWLNKDFLKIEQIKSIALSAPADPTFKPWKLVRQPKADGSPNPDGQYQLADISENEVMELTSTNQLRNLFAYSSFQDILSKEQAASSANPDQKLKRQATISTHDGLTYIIDFWPQKDKPIDPQADDRLPPVQPSYLLTVKVSAHIAQNRTPEKDESKEKPEVIKSRDADFEKKKKALEQKLAAAQILTGRIYQVGQSTVSPLQKQRSEFVKAKDKPTTLPALTPPTPLTPVPTP